MSDNVKNTFQNLKEDQMEKLDIYSKGFINKMAMQLIGYNANMIKLIDVQARELVICRAIMYHLRHDTITVDIVRTSLEELDALNAEVQRELQPAAVVAAETVNE